MKDSLVALVTKNVPEFKEWLRSVLTDMFG
jgi:hypothetical protein